MAAESNARKRINRFVDDHGDELLLLPRNRQNEILDLVYTNQGSLARSKLRAYSAVAAEKRHQVSIRSAVTKRTRDEQARIIVDALNQSIRHNPYMKKATQEADFATVRRNIKNNQDPEALPLIDRYEDNQSRLGDALRLRGNEVGGGQIISAAFYHGMAH